MVPGERDPVSALAQPGFTSHWQLQQHKNSPVSTVL